MYIHNIITKNMEYNNLENQSIPTFTIIYPSGSIKPENEQDVRRSIESQEKDPIEYNIEHTTTTNTSYYKIDYACKFFCVFIMIICNMISSSIYLHDHSKKNSESCNIYNTKLFMDIFSNTTNLINDKDVYRFIVSMNNRKTCGESDFWPILWFISPYIFIVILFFKFLYHDSYNNIY